MSDDLIQPPEVANVPLSDELAADFAAIQDFVGRTRPSSDPALQTWLDSLAADFDATAEHDPGNKNLNAVQYEAHPLSVTVADRTYCADFRIDKSYGARIPRILQFLTLMLERAAAFKPQHFVDRASAVGGITERRQRGYNFPVTLPYRNEAPNSELEVYQEEAVVVAYAINYALTRPGSGVEFYVKRYDASRGKWGIAPINKLNSSGYVSIKLNINNIINSVSDNRLASVAAHELLHCLGWGHPSGSYPATLAIEILEHCIATGDG